MSNNVNPNKQFGPYWNTGSHRDQQLMRFSSLQREWTDRCAIRSDYSTTGWCIDTGRSSLWSNTVDELLYISFSSCTSSRETFFSSSVLQFFRLKALSKPKAIGILIGICIAIAFVTSSFQLKRMTIGDAKEWQGEWQNDRGMTGTRNDRDRNDRDRHLPDDCPRHFPRHFPW